MGVAIEVEVLSLEKLPVALNRGLTRQLPFAESFGLNKWAKDIWNPRARAEADALFILRSTWVSRGITFNPSNKNQSIIHIEVGTRDEFMVKQELGGTHKPRKADHLAVPVTGPSGVRKSARQRITMAKRPTALRSKGKRKAFVIEKDNQLMLVRRKGKKAKPLDVLFMFEERADVEPIWHFVRNTEATAAQTLEATLHKTMVEVVTKELEREFRKLN